MNQTDEDNEAKDVPMTPQEVDEILEPKEIPLERIVRHAEKNDSYREAPSLGNDEEIIQPPLESVEEEYKSDISNQRNEVIQNGSSKDQEPLESKETAQLKELLQVKDATSVLTQGDVMKASVGTHLPEEPIQEKESVSVSPETSLPSLNAETIPSPEVIIKTESSPIAQGQTEEPIIYHTVSGGPETIQDKMASKLQKSQVESGINAPFIEVHSNESSASGYTIPNPNYVSPVQIQQAHGPQNSFGITIFLLIMTIIGGAVAYLYFFMPEMFDKIFDAIMIVFAEILKNFE